MTTDSSQYFKPFLFAIGLHIFIFILFFMSYSSSKPVAMTNTNAPVVQASLVSAPPAEIPTPPVASPPPVPKIVLDKQKVLENVAALQEEAEEEAQEMPLAEEKPLPPAPEKVVEKPIKKVEVVKPVKKKIATAKPKPLPPKNFHPTLVQDFDRALMEEGKLIAASAKSVTVNQAVIDRFKAEIVQAIGQRWIVPDLASHHDLKCKLFIHLGTRGRVLDVRLLSSSGDPALDRSAVAAVYKASPLPVPSDPAQFEPFRELNLTVRPV